MCLSHTFSNPKTLSLLVPLAPSAATDVPHHLQGLQKGQIHRSPFLSSASIKPPRIDWEGGEQNHLSTTFCSSGDPSGTLKQGTQREK